MNDLRCVELTYTYINILQYSNMCPVNPFSFILLFLLWESIPLREWILTQFFWSPQR